MNNQHLFILLFVITVYTIQARRIKLKITDAHDIPLQEAQGRPVDVIKPPPSSSQSLDLAFIMDTTGSMSSYIKSARQNIREIVEEISKSSNSDVRLALIEYRDHAPEDTTFVTRKHDFTDSVTRMKSWLNKANAAGGGDGPEAVADALFKSTKLSWRPNAAKISVLVSDAPPHGLVPNEDVSFPDGSPNGHDPMQIVGDLAQMGVTLYVIGCEPAIVPYKDFFMALAYRTGGQYVPLSVPRLLVNAITGGAQEELSLQKFETDVQQEMKKFVASGAPIDKQQIAASVLSRLRKAGATTTQLVKNSKALEGPSATAKLIAEATSMAEVRKVFKKGQTPRSSFSKPLWRDESFSKFRLYSSLGSSSPLSRVRFSDSALGAGVPASSVSDTLSTIESGVTMEQIKRLVEKESSKWTTV